MPVYTNFVRGETEPLLTGDPPPANIASSLRTWIASFLWVKAPMDLPYLNPEILGELERKLGVGVPFNSTTDDAAVRDLLERCDRSDDFAARVVALLLPRSEGDDLGEISAIYDSPKSRWEVVMLDGEARLTLRNTGPVSDVLDGVASFSAPAHRHLSTALTKLSQPGDPDLVGAYSEAIKAVEAAARPVVTPDDPSATLGKMLKALEVKPEKWAVVLTAETVEEVAGRIRAIWRTPHERHGTDQPGAPLTVEQTRAAFALALGLVDYFSRRLIHRVDDGSATDDERPDSLATGWFSSGPSGSPRGAEDGRCE